MARCILTCEVAVNHQVNMKMLKDKLDDVGLGWLTCSKDFEPICKFMFMVGAGSVHFKALQDFHAKMIDAKNRQISYETIGALGELPARFNRLRLALFKLAYAEDNTKNLPHCDVVKPVLVNWLASPKQRELADKAETWLARFHEAYKPHYTMMDDPTKIRLLGHVDMEMTACLLEKSKGAQEQLASLHEAAVRCDAIVRLAIKKAGKNSAGADMPEELTSKVTKERKETSKASTGEPATINPVNMKFDTNGKAITSQIEIMPDTEVPRFTKPNVAIVV
jgi:hypothetical protein